ncbi:MAG TPA: hypothetical protein VJR71_04965 [Pseudolabrys sp.]|nr:hypothetical protein [Pseudolabrys sp.]
MAYARTASPTHDFIVEKRERSRPGFWRWFLNVMLESRRRHADREIARYLDNGKFTDEAEREIERRFLSTPPRF